MVKKTIPVSRDGLTPCPGCGRHIKVAKNVAETTCLFCGTSITLSEDSFVKGAIRATARALMTGKTSIVAASLFGAAALVNVNCAADDDGNNTGAADDVVEEVGSTGSADDDAGTAGEDDDAGTSSQDDDAGTADKGETVGTTEAPTSGGQSDYGGAGDWGDDDAGDAGESN
jgi:hypothetical protein